MPKKIKLPKELHVVFKIAIDQGWTVEYTKNGHMKWTSPTGKPVFTGSTPSEPRGIKNHIAELKRAGLRLP